VSIQSQLIKLIISLVTIATFVASIHGYRNSQAYLNEVFDSELQTIAKLIAGGSVQANTQQTIDEQYLYQVFNKQGELLSRSSLAPQKAVSNLANGFSEQAFFGLRWRTYSVTNANYFVIVAHSQTYRDTIAEEMLMVTIIPVVISIPLIAMLIFYIVRKSLAPLRILSSQLHKKGSEDLSGVNLSKPSKELVPVVNRLNELFKRLDYAFELEKQLSANAAHELRTPISVLTLAINNMRNAFVKGELSESQFDDLMKNADRMAHVIEQIIHLFRFTPDNFFQKKSKVALEKVLQEVISNNYLSIEAAAQEIELHAKPLFTEGDAFALYVLFDNIIRNAQKYAGEGATILVTVTQQNHKLKIEIEDSGQGLSVDEIKNLSQRFFRGSNQTNIKGSGLGLSIVKHITQLHHGELAFGHSKLGGLKVTVSLPEYTDTSSKSDVKRGLNA
jgi:two-component system sensor histidine kinase QseC